MKSIYATLTSYNQYMEETRDTVLQCPELSTYGMDEGEGYSSSDDEFTLTPNGTMTWDADLEGKHLEPRVYTNASGTVSGTVDSEGITVLLKVRNLVSVNRVVLHALLDDEIGHETLVLYERAEDSTRVPRTGTLLARRFLFRDFKGPMTKKMFAQRLEHEQWGLVVYTTQYPDGEISGFLQETLYS